MDTRYIDAEHRLATALGWVGADYTGLAAVRDGRAQGMAPDGTRSGYVPAWARSGDDCVSLMLAHRCFVAAEVTSDGIEVMVARWKDAHGFPERLAVPSAEHASEDAAFRYAAVLGVTLQVEAKAQARELTSLVSA